VKISINPQNLFLPSQGSRKRTFIEEDSPAIQYGPYLFALWEPMWGQGELKKKSMREGRRRYYDLFSHFYDRFVAVHSHRDERNTRQFLVACARLEGLAEPRILDICCGTGSVILTFAQKYPQSTSIGLDFSHGMLRRAKGKASAEMVNLCEGDAALLPFSNGVFDVVTCSHALYELKGETRMDSLKEMKRVVKPGGRVLIMEHEVPTHPLIKFLFNIRMSLTGSAGAKAFLGAGLEPFQRLFSEVELSHSPSGKSRLVCCIK